MIEWYLDQNLIHFPVGGFRGIERLNREKGLIIQRYVVFISV